LINDKNNDAYKEDILNFFLLYHLDITPNIEFIDWLANIVNNKDSYKSELKSLVDNTLLILKTTENDELVIKGAQNKHIRDIWHKDEEEILFDMEILQRENIFDSVSKFRTIKRYLMENLKLDEEDFYAKTIDRLFKEDFEFKRAKLVYYMMKASNNINQTAENIYADLTLIDWEQEQDMDILICVKILVTILKNKIVEGESTFFADVRLFLIELNKMHPFIEQNYEDTFSPVSFDYYFFKHLVTTTLPVGYGHKFGEQINDTSAINNPPIEMPQSSNIYQSNMPTSQNVLGSLSGYGGANNTSHIGYQQSNYDSNNASYLGRRDNLNSHRSINIDNVSTDNRSTYGKVYNWQE
jgi:hypothetical protein